MLQTDLPQNLIAPHIPIDAVNALDLLESQHREIEALFAEFEKLGAGADKTRLKLFETIALNFLAHARIEEKFLYPEGRDVDIDMTLEAYEEHDVVRKIIRKLRTTKPSDETFKAQMTVFKEMIQHHVGEEEGTYFPELRKSLGDERLCELSELMQVEYDAFKDKHAPKAAKRKKSKRRSVH